MKSHYKTFSLSLFIGLFALTGCFGGGDTSEDIPANFIPYDAPTFSVQIPDNWEIIEPNDFAQSVPSETQVIFKENVKDSIFTPNVNITKSILRSAMSASDFARSSINQSKDSLLNYQEISRDDEYNMFVADQIQKTTLVMFEGKNSESDPMLRIIQAYAVKGSDAYTITAAYLKDEGDITVETAKNIVKSFKLK